MAALDPEAAVERVERFVHERGLLQPGPLVLAVSGGQDSLSMLDILRHIGPELGLSLVVAHLNHRFRGAQAEEEAAFVRQLAEEWSVPVEMGAIDVPAYRSEHRLSKQVAARYARYQFLARVAGKWRAGQVALGHTADDSAETLLLNLLRGSGLAGLRGLVASRQMQPRQLGPEVGSEFWLTPALPAVHGPLPRAVRPILHLTRAETEAYCRARGLPFRSDPSNLDIAYRRNWIRRELIPMMEKHVPGAMERLSSTAELLSEDWAIVSNVVDRLWHDVADVSGGRVVIDLQRWSESDQPVQRYLLRRAVEAVAGSLENIGRAHLDAAMETIREGNVGARVDLPGGIRLEKAYNSFLLTGPGVSEPVEERLPQEGLLLPVPGRVSLPSGEIEAAVIADQGLRSSWLDDPLEAHLDADRVGPVLVVRRRRVGDRFVPLGMAEPKKLQDFLVDQKVPRNDRDRVPVVATPEAVVWMAGYRIDDRFKVTDETKRVLVLKYRESGVENRESSTVRSGL